MTDKEEAYIAFDVKINQLSHLKDEIIFLKSEASTMDCTTEQLCEFEEILQDIREL